jgi:hypothetical protein
MGFYGLLAAASDEVRTFDRQVVDWVTDRGWRTYVRASHRNVLHPDVQYGVMFFPGWKTVQVSLREFGERGESPVAAGQARCLTARTGIPHVRTGKRFGLLATGGPGCGVGGMRAGCVDGLPARTPRGAHGFGRMRRPARSRRRAWDGDRY